MNHHHQGPKKVSIGIITVSSTRNENDDKTAIWMKKLIKNEGHIFHSYNIIKDDTNIISSTVKEITNNTDLQTLIISGGTGITYDDVTIESVRPLFAKELTAFGAIFAQLSYESIGPASILSRATAGIINGKLVFCIPGSFNAVKMACMEIIFPELSHFVGHLIKHDLEHQHQHQHDNQTVSQKIQKIEPIQDIAMNPAQATQKIEHSDENIIENDNPLEKKFKIL